MKKFNEFYNAIIESVNKTVETKHISKGEDIYKAGPCPFCGEYADRTHRSMSSMSSPVGCINGHVWFRPGQTKRDPIERIMKHWGVERSKIFDNKLNEENNTKTYALSEIESLLNHKKVAKLIDNILNATSEESYMKALRLFSGVTLNDIDIVDQLTAYSAEKLHYHQRLDNNVKDYLEALTELIKY